MNLKALGLAMTLAGMSCLSAQADDFNFSLSGVVDSTHNTSGTITGELIGLQDNMTSLPTEIIIDSTPSAFFNSFPGVFENGPGAAADGYSSTGGFTVTDGVITAADASFGFQPRDFGGLHAASALSFNFGGANEASDNGFPGPILGNENGFSGVTYSAVPEPGGWGLALLGASVLFAGRKLFGATHPA